MSPKKLSATFKVSMVWSVYRATTKQEDKMDRYTVNTTTS